MKTTIKTALLVGSAWLFSCSNNAKDQPVVEEPHFLYLYDYIKEDTALLLKDTSSLLSWRDFSNDLDLIPSEFGELIINEYVYPSGNTRHLNAQYKTDSMYITRGMRTNSRIDPFKKHSPNSVFLIVAGYQNGEANGDYILVDFDNHTITGYYPEHDSISYLKPIDSSEIYFKGSYEDIKIDSTKIDFDAYTKMLKALEEDRHKNDQLD